MVSLHSKFYIFCSICIISHNSSWWGSAGIQLTCAYKSRAPEKVFTALVLWHWHKLHRILRLLKNHIQREHHTGKQVVKQGTVHRSVVDLGGFFEVLAAYPGGRVLLNTDTKEHLTVKYGTYLHKTQYASGLF